MSQKKQQKGKAQKKQQQKGKAQKKQQQKGKAQNQQQQKTPITHKIKYVLGFALLIGLIILAVYLIKKEKEVETPTQQLEKFQTESPTPSNTTNYVFNMSKGNTFKICPNGPCTFPPNHVINIKVSGAKVNFNAADFPGYSGIKLDTTNVKRSNEGYLPSFNVIYDQSNTFTCNDTKSINLAKEQDNISKDDGGYVYNTGRNIEGMCHASQYAMYVITVPTDIPYGHPEMVNGFSTWSYSNTTVNEGLIIDMTQMAASNAACKCQGGKGTLLPSVQIKYDALTTKTPTAE